MRGVSHAIELKVFVTVCVQVSVSLTSQKTTNEDMCVSTVILLKDSDPCCEIREPAQLDQYHRLFPEYDGYSSSFQLSFFIASTVIFELFQESNRNFNHKINWCFSDRPFNRGERS